MTPNEHETLPTTAIKVFLNVTEAWGLTDQERAAILDIKDTATLTEWKNDPTIPLPVYTMERISYVIGIHQALQRLLSGSPTANEWVKRPNTDPLFGGKSALEKICSGNIEDLHITKQYFEAQCHGWG